MTVLYSHHMQHQIHSVMAPLHTWNSKILNIEKGIKTVGQYIDDQTKE